MFFRRGSPGCQLLIKQLQEFPNGDHDDGPDVLEQAMRRALEACSASVDDLMVENPF
jgi:phage terminase large subunit-like protein